MQGTLQSKSPHRARLILAAAAWAIGASMIAWYVAAFGVNVPINDDWDQVSVSVRWSERLEAISRHYGAEGILQRIAGMRRAGILHPD